MYHSVYFGDKNSWDDWYLIPTSRPVIPPPSQKRTTIELPGADGIIDLSTALTGFPTYTNRSGSIEFMVENGHNYWYELYSTIMDYLHGKKMRMRLEDDMAYYYDGTMAVSGWRSDVHWSYITIAYDVDPYKYSVHTTCEDWIWDPFDFQNGIMAQNYFKNIRVNSTEEYQTINIPMVLYDKHMYGRKPEVVKLSWTPVDDSALTLHFTNQELGINMTKTYDTALVGYLDPDIIVSDISQENTVVFEAIGDGFLSIDFRLARF